MTDRHIHCVYFHYDDPNNIEGECLLKNETVEGFKPHCDCIVLRPQLLLSYFLKHEHYCGDWECADRKALEYLDKVGFNSFPHKEKRGLKDV